MARFLLCHESPELTPTVRDRLAHPLVAGLRLLGPALEDGDGIRRLAAAVHAVGSAEPRTAAELPCLVAVDPRDLPAALAAPEAARQARELAAGGEAMDVTLEVLDWARSLAELGFDLVFAPSLSGGPRELAGAWLEAIHAAGLVAAPGPVPAAAIRADEGSEAWSAVGDALAHGAEALRLDHEVDAGELERLRTEKAVDAVLVGSAEGADLVELADAEALENADVDAYGPSDRRVDRLRLEWLA